MTNFRYFEIYMSILNAILTLYKLERFNILNLNTNNEMNSADGEIINELRAAIQVPLILPEIIELLKQFNKINPQQTEIDFRNPILRCHIT